jgi:calnexin
VYRKGIEHHLKRPHWIPIDTFIHLYTLVLRQNGTFETLIDDRSTRNGTFLTDFDPPLFEAPTIDDPNDQKPTDWVDDVFVPDPTAVKPADWIESLPENTPVPITRTPPPGWLPHVSPKIPDPRAKKPASWNENLMGEWKRPLIPNPSCARVPGCGPYTPRPIPSPKVKGVWKPSLISNPKYIGEWRPRQIPNPNYHGASTVFEIPEITAIGFNIWAANRDIAITNILIAHDENAVRAWNREDFAVRQRRQIRTGTVRYDWLNIDVPDESRDPGLFGLISYHWRLLHAKWVRFRHKPLVIALVAIVVCMLVPILVCVADSCNDPFVKIKDD